MYYTNISYDEALKCKDNIKIFVWTDKDRDWQEGQYEVSFDIDLASHVDETSYYIGVKDLIYVTHLN